MRKSRDICDDVKNILKLAREQRGDQAVDIGRMEQMFGITGIGVTLKDLDDFQLLQALFIESQWALGQQAKEMAMVKQVAGLNRQQRRRR